MRLRLLHRRSTGFASARLRHPRRPGWLWAGPLLAALACLAPLRAHSAVDDSQTLKQIEQQFRRGEIGAAQTRLDQGLQALPGDPGLRFLKAVILAETGQADQAAQWLERLTQDFPEMPEPYNNLAVLNARAGKLDQARALLESALRLDPRYRTAHENLGDIYIQLAQQAYQAAAPAAPAAPSSTLLAKLRLARELLLAR